MTERKNIKPTPKGEFRGGNAHKGDRQAKFAIITRIRSASNAELLDLMLEIAPGNDYDGCFTPLGEYEFYHTLRELKRRLGAWLEE
jgi:hypothetical protein